MKTLTRRDRWIRLTEANPQVKNLALAEYENITWRSSDGQTIEGILIYPNMPHGLRNARYQLIKMEAEFAWFEKWI